MLAYSGILKGTRWGPMQRKWECPILQINQDLKFVSDINVTFFSDYKFDTGYQVNVEDFKINQDILLY